ncbi:hypothetical protein [Aetokthonos hydrillicola]|nr:hypothetical protein [Aetokthonos hydrillicola]MBW4585168.1 hypothetical protein [Aetokthonos hydrillicola CCALA 1050]
MFLLTVCCYFASRRDGLWKKDGNGSWTHDGWKLYYSRDGGANWRKGASGKFPQWLIHPAIAFNPGFTFFPPLLPAKSSLPI